MKKIIPFNYFGGKYNHLDFILRHLPHTRSYVEVFGGSGVVLLNKKPCKIETYNDLSGTVVNFFQQLRERPEELLTAITLTPYSLDEYHKCYRNIDEGDGIERARRFFVAVSQSFNGTFSRQTGWKISTKVCRSHISEAINRWLNKVPYLEYAVNRLRSVQISNWDFALCFEKFNHPDVLLYCDPLYTHDTRCNSIEYEHEMKDEDHERLIELASSTSAKVAISGYSNKLYNARLKDFYRISAKPKRSTMFHSPRQEVLWTNYDPILNQELF